MAKKQHHEEHVDESWLIPYADVLTLLLALFIVMFAAGQTDQEKFNKMKEQFAVIFEGGGESIINGGETSIGIQGGNTFLNASQAAKQEEEKMQKIKEDLDKQINEEGFEGKIETQINGEGLEISLQNAALFDSGQDIIKKDVKLILTSIAKMLSGLNNDIKVSGHTDNIPIYTQKFRSNWELSLSRALSVMYHLSTTTLLSEEKFVIQGYGENKPKFDNETQEGRAKNRRVEIIIVRKHPRVMIDVDGNVIRNEGDGSEYQFQGSEKQNSKNQNSDEDLNNLGNNID